jgi:hypothetical protein
MKLAILFLLLALLLSTAENADARRGRKGGYT